MTASSNDGSSSVETALLPEGRRSVPRLIEASGGTAGWLAALICAAVYLALIVPLTSFPMQDYANHVARAHIMADLFFHHGADFGRFFEVHLAPVPYVLPDLLLMVAVEAFGPSIGAGLFTSLVILSLPCALLFYALKRLGLDVAPDVRPPQEQHIVLVNRDEIEPLLKRPSQT